MSPQQSTPEGNQVLLQRPPGIGAAYARAAAVSALPRAASRVLPGLPERSDALPEAELVLAEHEVDTEHLARYARVCGFTLTDQLPVTYPHVLVMGMQMRLLTAPSFPFPAAGLVHLRNTITQYEPLTVADVLRLRVHATNMRPHPKGTLFTVVSTAEAGGKQAWRDESHYLHRRSGADEHAEPDPPLPVGEPPQEPMARWRVPADIGRRYAKVSGDSNPIHISRWGAKAFGFPTMIAHGMWTKARVLAAVAPRLPGRLSVDVRFQAPMLLPAKAELRSTVDATGAGGVWLDRVASSGSKTHLEGMITPL